MKLSTAGLELIKRSEGFRSYVYKDVAGISTIGFGHRVSTGESFAEGVDEAQATILLSSDVLEAERTVCRLVRVALTQGQFDALVDFCFNLGAGRLTTSSLLRELNAGRYETAGEQLLRWEFAGGVVNSGLKARRHAEFELWTKGNAAGSTMPQFVSQVSAPHQA
jgi:lysozyme